MGQPQSVPQTGRQSQARVYYDGSRDDEDDENTTTPQQNNGMAIFDEENDPSPNLENNSEEQHSSHHEQIPLTDYGDGDDPLATTATTTTLTTSIDHHHHHQNVVERDRDAAAAAATTSSLMDAFQDHYSLGGSSVKLRFRSRNLRILDDDHNSQLVLEEEMKTNQDAAASSAVKGNNSSSHNKAANSSNKATVRRLSTTNFGMALLRTVFYTLPALFIMTCTWAFGAQVLLFNYMNIVGIQTNQSWDENPPTIDIIGATLAVPLLLYSLGTCMTMSWALVVDCWRGLGSSEQSLLRNMVYWDPMVTEWICLAVFAGVPLLTLIIKTLQRDDNWYETTVAAWAIATLAFQTFYMLLCFLNEMHMCASLLKRYMPNIYDARANIPKWMKLVEANILLTQRQKYSGLRHERYLVNGNALPPAGGFSSDRRFVPVQYQLPWGSRWTLDGYLWGLCGNMNRKFFTPLDPPVRNYSLDEVFGNVMILSKSNWTLERIWCMDRKRSAAVTLTEGKSSVSEAQMRSGHACIGVSALLIILTIAGFLTWTGQSAIVIFVIVLIVFCCCIFPILQSSYLVHRFQSTARAKIQDNVDEAATGGDVPSPSGDEEDPKISSKDANSNNNQSSKKVSFYSANSQVPGDQDKLTNTAFISVWESVRISEMKPWLCWTTAILEVTIFFVWPFISLYATKNLPVAVVFMCMGIPSVMRHYFNVSNLLQELGPIDKLDLTSSQLSPALCGLGGKGGSILSSSLRYEEDRKLRNQALVATIVRRVTRSSATKNWIGLFFFLFFCVFAGFLMASTEESFDYKVKGVVFPQGFYYDPQPQLPYPSCSVQKGFAFPGQNSASSLADYAFLATVSFSGPNESVPLLNNWFGEGLVVDNYEFVEQYRNATGTASHPVSYKLFTIPSLPDAAIVSIRGSESMWDWMVDIQLWCGAVLAQIIHLVNPLGWLWEPILDDVVYFINSVQSRQLKEVSYYRYTSAFVFDMYEGFGGRQYSDIRTTGASLGGGLAILTGAITGASAVAISGLNAMYSRHTFDPPITKEQLNTRIFNTIPQRDPIAHIDEPGMLRQHMQCRGAKNSLFACHSMYRSLCEFQYQCGTNGRPINCWCTSKYGYPVPESNGTVTWDEACADA